MKNDMAMQENYEPSNPLCLPFECFTYDSMTKPFPIEVHWHYFAEIILAEKDAKSTYCSKPTKASGLSKSSESTKSVRKSSMKLRKK